MRHIYVFGPPGSQKTVMMIKANAEKFGTTEDSEWITLVHGLFDEMENPFQKPNALEVVTREVFEEKAQLEIRFHTQLVDGRPHPAVEFTVSNQSGPRHLALADAQAIGDLFRQFIQASWVAPLIAGRLASVPG
jgi:hypothetical protein